MHGITVKSWPDETRKNLANRFNGSIKKPIQREEDLIPGIENVNVFVKVGTIFKMEFWEEIYRNNIAVIYKD